MFFLPVQKEPKKTPAIDVQPDCRKQLCAAEVHGSLYIIALTVDGIDLTLAVSISGRWKGRNAPRNIIIAAIAGLQTNFG
jgi:hypothetical protein